MFSNEHDVVSDAGRGKSKRTGEVLLLLQPMTHWPISCPVSLFLVCVFTDVNECLSGPCLNAATCHDLSNGYSCTPCPLHATGFNCERSKLCSIAGLLLHGSMRLGAGW